MKRGLCLSGLVLGFLTLVSCGPTERSLVPLHVGRIDFIAKDRLVDVRTESDSDVRTFNGFQFVRGWVRSGPGGKWAAGSTAEIKFYSEPNAKYLWIECRPDHQLDGQQVVSVVVDGKAVGEFRPESKFEWYQIELPETKTSVTRHLELQFEKVRTVDRGVDGVDTRPLALMVRRLALTDDSPAVAKLARAAEVSRTSRGLRVKTAGRLYLNFTSEAPVSEIEVGLRAEEGNVAAVSLTLVRPETGERLEQLVVDRRAGEDSRVSLNADGNSGAFQLIVDVNEDGLIIDRIQARVHSVSTTKGERNPKTDVGTSPSDIVVIVLDALRADRSGSTYGYSRDTMPNVDQFAAEAFVFDRVFAQAPYTTCSVPTMFSGLSWQSHGVVQGEDRLLEEEETLAESLRAAGFQTVGISATPNNSKRLGMEQGFDEFEQLWEGLNWRNSIDPMVAVDRVRTKLQQSSNDKPLFLMIHLVPPHSPYTPPEEFRRWSDPMYDGPCDGTEKYLKSARRNRQAISPADIAELSALYDGNLRFSDAAVGQILQALEDSGRLEDAIVVITSDHGEALLEHGHLGHNSSIYDEMLSVPLIIRLPEGFEVNSDVDRLASLEDLTPTLLGLVGVNAPSRITGVDLFSEQPRSDISIRTTESQGLVGFRTERWKLIADSAGMLVELYDLEADRGELENVLLKYPEHVSWLADCWERAEAQLPPKLDRIDGSDSDMSDSEKAMLQELGYIE